MLLHYTLDGRPQPGPASRRGSTVPPAVGSKPPLGDQGEVARRSRDGGDQSWQRPEAYNPSVTLRVTAPFAQGSLPSQASGLTALGVGASDSAARAAMKAAPTASLPVFS